MEVDKRRGRGDQVTLDAGPLRQRLMTPPGGTQLWLTVFHVDGVEVVPLVERLPLVIGRSTMADIVVRDPEISRQHLRCELVNGRVEARDLGSRNGTRCRGKPFEHGRLGPGDELSMGAVTLAVHAREASQSPPVALLGHTRFMQLLEHEGQRACSFGQTLGMLVVGAEAEHAHRLRQVAPLLRRVVGTADLLAIYAADRIELGLLQCNRARAREVAEKILALAGNGVLTPAGFRCGVALLPGMAGSGEELVTAAHAALQGASTESPIAFARELTSEHPSVQIRRPTVERLARAPVVASECMLEFYELLRTVARADMPVLIHGETGVGKEVVARQLHEHSARRKGPFQALNCGAIPVGLVESTLFGHERGAFTGASREARGIFEAANGGTLLLDEIGELPASAQAALLRVLEQGQIERVGGTQLRGVDVRVVAATHRDLESMAQQQLFRRDLLFRLNAVVLDVPPLRRRREEIVPLAEHFADLVGAASGKPVEGFTSEAEQMLTTYSWPGNIRQLRNVVERAVCLCTDELIGPGALPEDIRAQSFVDDAPGALAEPAGPEDTADLDFRARIQRFEQRLILDALRECDGNQTRAAERLKIPQRTLTRKIQALGLKRLGFVADDGAREGAD